ncbi:MAG: MFS transporter [Sphingomonas sp. 28-66-16]|nr:MAG: MFS transporter [Sphingomonas sp. 28-66-16]
MLSSPDALNAADDGLPMPRRLLAIAALSFGTSLVIIDGSIATVALPTIARDLHVERSAVVSIVTIYQLVFVMLLLPMAGLGERLGLKRLYQSGQLVFAVATLLCFFAKSLPLLLVVRAVQALGAAAALSVSSALIRSVYPARQLGRGLGINTIFVTSSAALAPSLGGLILSIAPWPWVFMSAVPFAILSLFLGRALPAPEPRIEPFDLIGAVLCAAMFGLIIGGIEAGVHGTSLPAAAASVIVGIVVGLFFVRRERGEPKPILPVDLLATPILALSATGAFTAFIASMTLLLSTPFRLQLVYGFTPAQVGIAIAAWPLTNMIVAPTAGWLSDRIAAGLLGGIGMAVSIVGLMLMAFLPEHAGVADVTWRMALCGSGFGIFLSPNARLVIGSAPRHRAAAAGGLVSTVRLVGQTAGATLVATLLALGVGTGRVPAFVAAGFALIAGLCSVARLRPSVSGASGFEAMIEPVQPS